MQAERGDYDYFRASYPAFRQRAARLGERVLSLANALMVHQRPRNVARLPDLEAVQEQFDDAIELLDSMLEMAVRARGAPAPVPWPCPLARGPPS